MAGASSSLWSQAQTFYVQVVTPAPPAPVVLATKAPGASFSVQAATVSGFTYFLEYTTSFVGGTWTTAAQTAGDGTLQTLTDPAATGPQRFYRLRVQ
jgi:hypothetical protein